MAVATGAWIFHVAALAFAPLSVVQAVLSTGVVILAVMAERIFGFQVGPRQWIGVAHDRARPAAARDHASGRTGAHSAYSVAGMIAFEGAMLVDRRAADRRQAPRRCPTTTTASCSAPPRACSSASPTSPSRRSPAPTASSASSPRPWLAVTVLASVVAFYASARGLQDGEAVPVIAATSTAANVSCILGGIIVFGDPMPGDALGIAVQASPSCLRRRRRAGHPAAGPRARAPPPHAIRPRRDALRAAPAASTAAARGRPTWGRARSRPA